MLRDSGVGWFVGNVYVGALAYADDIALLAPTASAMRQLLCISDQYSEKSLLRLMLPCQPGCLLVKVSNSVLVFLSLKG